MTRPRRPATTKTCKLHPAIAEYIGLVERGKVVACRDQHQLVALVKRCFDEEDIYTNAEQLDKYLSLQKYFPFDLFPWEKFLLALHDCTYWRKDNTPRWPTLFCLVGRGAGKDGFMAFEAMCLTSHHHGVRSYDIDICANNQEQAMRPMTDLTDVFEMPENIEKMKRFFYWNKEKVVNRKTKSTVIGRTNSPKGKDGLRSGKVNFNEIHQYENYDNINVFTTGLGKKPHPRRGFFTTQGDVRDGPLDDMLERSEQILKQGEPDRGMLPFVCRLDSKDDVHEQKNWQKANPSIIYLPDLMRETSDEYEQWKSNPEHLPAFMTKRMNLPQTKTEVSVTEYANIKITKRDLPDLTGRKATLGLDFMRVGDFASANLHFLDGEQRYDISHSWLCAESKDIPRIKAPWRQWAADGKLTVVNDVEIHPDLLCEYIMQNGQKYDIQGLALDNYRYALLQRYLSGIGFDAKTNKNVKLVRPSDIMQLVPVVDRCFTNQLFTWGDNPVLRWATNNTKLERRGSKGGVDTGNFVYAKIEGRSRKTDPFMALVASMTIEHLLEQPVFDVPDIPVFTF